MMHNLNLFEENIQRQTNVETQLYVREEFGLMVSKLQVEGRVLWMGRHFIRERLFWNLSCILVCFQTEKE